MFSAIVILYPYFTIPFVCTMFVISVYAARATVRNLKELQQWRKVAAHVPKRAHPALGMLTDYRVKNPEELAAVLKKNRLWDQLEGD